MGGPSFPCAAAILLVGMLGQPFAQAIPDVEQPIHLSLSFVRSNPVTTITVGGRDVQAVIDTGGDGAVTLSRDVIASAGGLRLRDALVSTDPFGREVRKPRFRVPVITIGGRTFENIDVAQMPIRPAGDGPPVPNGIGRQFLGRYFAVVDYAGGFIDLWPPGARNVDRTNCGSTRIPMQRTEQSELIVSYFDTQSGRISLLWDTGAASSVLTEAVAENLRLTTMLRGQTKFYQSKTLTAVGRDFGPIEFVVLPLKLPEDFQGLLGENFFEHHVVCLDYQLREIRVR